MAATKEEQYDVVIIGAGEALLRTIETRITSSDDTDVQVSRASISHTDYKNETPSFHTRSLRAGTKSAELGVCSSILVDGP